MTDGIVHYAVVVSPELGDDKDEATIEIRLHGKSVRVSASPTRSRALRGTAFWTSDNGPLEFPSVADAKDAVEKYHGKLKWGEKKI